MDSEQKIEFDVFISYSSQDKAWVRGELLTCLNAAGLKVCTDKENFIPGAPILTEIERAIETSRKTLLIFTPSYLASEWTKLESLILQTEDPSNRNLKFIPVYKDDCEIPKRIKPFTPVYFTDPTEEANSWRQLLTALGKPPEPEPPQQAQPEQWLLAHPYPMPPNFTGRVAERQMLDQWLNADAAYPLLSIRALGGFGKSALVWHWLTHDVRSAAWPRVVWWSFYESDASFDRFLAETLAYLSGCALDATQCAGKNAVTMLLQMLREPGTLLVLDGFERELRAFGGLNAAYQGDVTQRDSHDRDCISPLAEWFLLNLATLPQLRSKVLLTTRLCPRVLEAKGGGLLTGCREAELKQMQPADAVAFFHAQGIRGTHTEIEMACARYGYHPLSLRLLAGLVVGDFQQPGDIAAAKRLDVSGDLIQRQHHVLETAYDSLAPSRQALLGRIACFRSPVSYETLKALAEEERQRDGEKEGQRSKKQRNKSASPIPPSLPPSFPPSSLDADLRDLVARGLLHHDVRERRFDLHPIVRRYAYDRLAATDREAAHIRLRDYFAAVPEPDNVTRLEDLAPVIELYHHTVRAGQLDEALTLFSDRLTKPLYFQLGAYLLIIDLLHPLFPDGEGYPPRLKDEAWQAWTQNSLAAAYGFSGQPRRAALLLEQDIVILERLGLKDILITPLENVAQLQLVIGALRAAEANLRQSIVLCREINEEFWEAVGHSELGRLLAYRGADAESETELATGAIMFEVQNEAQYQSVTWTFRSQRELLRLRATAPSAARNSQSAIEAARRALELADETSHTRHPFERDYVRAHWLLGAAHLVASQLDESERHLHEALERCRRINNVENEADILIDLARLSAATGAPDEAQRLAEEARLIAERSGYVLQGADAHLELARLALKRDDLATAREHAQQARTLATCDGPPDYTYKAAYDEAGALLEQLG